MKRFKEIIQSTVEPSNTNVLWLNPDIDELLYYSSNGWSPIYLDSSIIEPKSIKIEKVETHMGKDEITDPSYYLYKVNINPSSTNIPHKVLWSIKGDILMQKDPYNEYYCKIVHINNASIKDEFELTATVTYGNKSISDTVKVEFCSYLTINIKSNLNGVDDYLWLSSYGTLIIRAENLDAANIFIMPGTTVKVPPNADIYVANDFGLMDMYDWSLPINPDSGFIKISSGDIGQYVTKTINVKARAVKVNLTYKGLPVKNSELDGIYSESTVTTSLSENDIIGGGQIMEDGSILVIRPYSIKNVRIVSITSREGRESILYEDIITDDIKDIYTETTLLGFLASERDDIILSLSSKNPEVFAKLATNDYPRTFYSYYTKDDVAKITDIGTIFSSSNIKTFDEFLYFTGVTELSRGAFEKCTFLTSIKIPDSITVFKNRCFSFTAIKNIVLPSNLTAIGESCFLQCKSLLSITIPEGITTIEDSTFLNCSSLSSVYLPNSLSSIKSSAFRSCTSLLSISIPNNVTTIMDNAFKFCSSLSTLNISKDCNLLTIGNEAFYGIKISELLIPKNVNLIGLNAFYNIETLLSITFYGTQAESKVTIRPYAFAMNTGKTSTLNTIKFMSTYIKLPNIISIDNTIFNNVASNGNIYVLAFADSSWGSEVSIKYLVDEKNWTLNYTTMPW